MGLGGCGAIGFCDYSDECGEDLQAGADEEKIGIFLHKNPPDAWPGGLFLIRGKKVVSGTEFRWSFNRELGCNGLELADQVLEKEIRD